MPLRHRAEPVNDGTGRRVREGLRAERDKLRATAEVLRELICQILTLKVETFWKVRYEINIFCEVFYLHLSSSLPD